MYEMSTLPWAWLVTSGQPFSFSRRLTQAVPNIFNAPVL